MKYQIIYLEEVRKQVSALSVTIRQLIKTAIEERLMTNPISFGKPLRYSLKGFRRLRVGDYRITYEVKNNIVIIVAIKHRKDVYD
jgi:addiction module RelE/StbE family toxin